MNILNVTPFLLELPELLDWTEFEFPELALVVEVELISSEEEALSSEVFISVMSAKLPFSWIYRVCGCSLICSVYSNSQKINISEKNILQKSNKIDYKNRIKSLKIFQLKFE